MTMKKNMLTVVAFLMLSASIFAQRDSVLSVTTAYITPLNSGLQLQDEEVEDEDLEVHQPHLKRRRLSASRDDSEIHQDES